MNQSKLQRLSVACDRPGAGVQEAKAYIQELAREAGSPPEVVRRMGEMVERSAVEHRANIRANMAIHGVTEAAAIVPPGIRNA
jgi:hypothetical protein